MTESSNQLDKVISKIQKLLAMAADTSTPNEALIAARRARALMDKYQLSKADIESKAGNQFLETKANMTGSVRKQWLLKLSSSAAILNDCVGAVSRAPYVQYFFQGFKADAIVAKLTMDYLVEACERQLKSSGITGASNRNFFRVGFSEQVQLRALQITEERKKTFVNDTGTALVPLKKELITNHFGKLNPLKHQKRRRPSRDEEDAYTEGMRQGQTVSLEKQIENEKEAA
ncbi:MAG: hypothetical protein CENE_00011 [Candidatus Celerinatantimonas neptuna]|nr:MAG: hypothetical protein CENE_00011 [Candidatus Celerinatantimonas neptuna]